MFSLFKLGSEKMKVFKTIFLCVVLVFALAGCGNSHAEADKTVNERGSRICSGRCAGEGEHSAGGSNRVGT